MPGDVREPTEQDSDHQHPTVDLQPPRQTRRHHSERSVQVPTRSVTERRKKQGPHRAQQVPLHLLKLGQILRWRGGDNLLRERPEGVHENLRHSKSQRRQGSHRPGGIREKATDLRGKGSRRRRDSGGRGGRRARRRRNPKVHGNPSRRPSRREKERRPPQRRPSMETHELRLPLQWVGESGDGGGCHERRHGQRASSSTFEMLRLLYHDKPSSSRQKTNHTVSQLGHYMGLGQMENDTGLNRPIIHNNMTVVFPALHLANYRRTRGISFPLISVKFLEYWISMHGAPSSRGDGAQGRRRSRGGRRPASSFPIGLRRSSTGERRLPVWTSSSFSISPLSFPFLSDAHSVFCRFRGFSVWTRQIHFDLSCLWS